jgi:hypothetical protein
VKLQLIPSRAVQELLDLTGLGSALEICSPESVQPALSLPKDSVIGVAADD